MLLELWQVRCCEHYPGGLSQHPTTHSVKKEPFPNMQPDPPLSQLHAVPSGPVAVPRAELSTCPSATLMRKQATMRPPLGLLCSGLNKPRHLSHSSCVCLSRPCTIFVTLLWTLFNCFMSLYYNIQNCTQYLRWYCTSAEQSGTITSLNQLVVLCLMHSMVRLVLLAARIYCCTLYSSYHLQHHYALSSICCQTDKKTRCSTTFTLTTAAFL